MTSPRTRATTLLTLAAAAALVVPATPAHAAPEHAHPATRALADCQRLKVEPRKVVSACADGGEYAVVKRYDSWRAGSATGSGRLVVNDCKPDCASGTFHSYLATFGFHRVVQTKRGPVFSRLGVTYVKGGEQHDTQLVLPTRPL